MKVKLNHEIRHIYQLHEAMNQGLTVVTTGGKDPEPLFAGSTRCAMRYAISRFQYFPSTQVFTGHSLLEFHKGKCTSYTKITRMLRPDEIRRQQDEIDCKGTVTEWEADWTDDKWRYKGKCVPSMSCSLNPYGLKKTVYNSENAARLVVSLRARGHAAQIVILKKRFKNGNARYHVRYR